MPTMTRYKDYRKFLYDFYREQQKEDPSFSYRKYAKLVKMKNVGFLHNIIHGRRKPYVANILKIARCIELNDLDTRYFVHLVEYTHAEGAAVKQFYEKELQYVKASEGKRAKKT